MLSFGMRTGKIVANSGRFPALNCFVFDLPQVIEEAGTAPQGVTFVMSLAATTTVEAVT